MPILQRLNADSSWYIEYGGTSVIIDPWLIGDDVAGFKWFSHQKHIHAPIAMSELPQVDGILVSQQYPDHCHIETIQGLDANTPIFATHHAYHKLTAYFGASRSIQPISVGAWTPWRGWEIMSVKRKGLLSPNFYAIVIALPNKHAIFYAPHGFELTRDELDTIKHLTFDLVITTFTHFVLPAFLGGEINLGAAAAKKLIEQLGPKYAVNTHDEMKEKYGLVAKIARVIPFDQDRAKPHGMYTPIPFDGKKHNLQIKH